MEAKSKTSHLPSLQCVLVHTGEIGYATLKKPQNTLIQASTSLGLMVLYKDFYFKIAVAKIGVLLIPILIWACSANSIFIYFGVF